MRPTTPSSSSTTSTRRRSDSRSRGMALRQCHPPRGCLRRRRRAARAAPPGGPGPRAGRREPGGPSFSHRSHPLPFPSPRVLLVSSNAGRRNCPIVRASRRRRVELRTRGGMAMIGYVTIGVNDMQRSVAFYDALLGEVGGKQIFGMDRIKFYGNGPGKPMLAICTPYDKQPPHRATATWWRSRGARARASTSSTPRRSRWERAMRARPERACPPSTAPTCAILTATSSVSST